MFLGIILTRQAGIPYVEQIWNSAGWNLEGSGIFLVVLPGWPLCPGEPMHSGGWLILTPPPFRYRYLWTQVPACWKAETGKQPSLPWGDGHTVTPRQ